MTHNPEYLGIIDYIKNLTKFGINLGLERIRALLERLGNPEKSLNIIHIGGTNGKGSTTAILQSILEQAGYRVGMFISPHLHDYRERISINREMISQARIIEIIRQIQPHLDALLAEGVEHPTEFEVSTALALTYFALEKPDFVLLEVGMGGAIDSTNVVTPWISVITSIGMDHTEYLGETLGRIAEVKAGIIKQGIPVVTSVDKTEALEVIHKQALKNKAKLIIVGQDVHWKSTKGMEGIFDYEGLTRSYRGLELSLYGQHQFNNASNALAACELLDDYQVNIPEYAIRQGLKSVKWPGRLEIIEENPKILLDGAHNAEGMKSLAYALQYYAEGSFKRNRLILCLGMLKDKEIEEALKFIVPLADIVVVTKPDSPRAGNWRNLAVLAEKYLSQECVQSVEDPVEAVKKCLEMQEENDMLCVTGSLYMIAPVRKFLLDRINLR